MASHTFRLGDDGTMDTVIVCNDCGQQLRYSFDPTPDEDYCDAYDDFVDWCLEDAAEQHDCKDGD